ncbi:MAG TPA: SurA N-terminal domain-containing protein [Syntrophales bacterium]|nr:SurA N-terminal domain-containing protein [Syntrophales bacterium]HOM07112.1 SurA N-terminal domain-containing protein [Syntrophales bacterium]HOO00373.1 SurA N-terminal domain-containing protein [Syntrophales bacterium]HPC00444.1 SurA N-terminal domain-containing protein [Syntrophales bacterium]HPQ05527.1 SurA N-terminal domain-containing protein [Syntrophales bacterium]
MLEIMRKHAKNWIMKVLLGIIIVVFIFYFGSTAGRKKAETIVSVDGKAISVLEFQKEYRDLMESYRQRLGGKLPDELLKSKEMKQQVLDNLVNQAILLKKAQELKIDVTDEELSSFITSLPAFQRQGRFDERLYQQVLKMHRMTPEDFEILQKRNLTALKLQELIQDAAHVTDQEILDFYRARNDRVNLTMVKVPLAPFRREIHPSRGELEEYLKENSAAFRVPEEMRVKYVFFGAQDFGRRVTVTEEEIREAYGRQRPAKAGAKEGPTKAERERIAAELRRARGMAEAFKEAKKAHDIIYQRDNFEEYLSRLGLTVETTPFFSSRSVPPPLRGIKDLERQVLPLQKNDLSPVLQGDNGYFLLKVAEKRPSHTPPFGEIEEELRRRVTDRKAQALAREEALRLIERMKKGEALAKLARERALPMEETGLFPLFAPPAKLGPATGPLMSHLSRLSPSRPWVDEPLPAPDGYVVIQLKERERATEEGLDKQREVLRETLRAVKRSELIGAWIEETRKGMVKEGRIKYYQEVKDL